MYNRGIHTQQERVSLEIWFQRQFGKIWQKFKMDIRCDEFILQICLPKLQEICERMFAAGWFAEGKKKKEKQNTQIKKQHEIDKGPFT